MTPVTASAVPGPSRLGGGDGTLTGTGRRPRTVIVVENLSVPVDRRVWQEACTLGRAGWDVDVICPRGRVRDTEVSVVIDGVRIHRYDLAEARDDRRGYVSEYTRATTRVARLVRRLARETTVDVAHVCNPPDVMVPAVRLALGASVPIIFDHHDLVPELYEARFGRSSGLVLRACRAAERLAYRIADVVVVPNEAYRSVALSRGHKQAPDVFVVRNAPDIARFVPRTPEAALRRGRPHLIAYLGVMGPQDGVDNAIEALAHLARTRRDWHAVFLGDGDVLPEMVRLAGRLGISELVEFAGMVGDDVITAVLSTADVCLAPDPPNDFNRRSSMNKVVEYMAMGRPIVAYADTDAATTAAGAVLLASDTTAAALAQAVDRLLDDADLRAQLGTQGRAVVETSLNWATSEAALLAAYERARRARS